jgi:integrase
MERGDTLPKKINFTKRSIEALVLPSTDRVYVYDSKSPGLCLCLTATGQRTWYRYGRIDGQPKRYRIGPYPEITVENARKASAVVSVQVAEGKDPHAERLASKREHTIEGLFLHWLDHAKVHKRTWKEDQRQYGKLLAPLHKRRLSTISKGEMQTLHHRVGKENGPYSANRLLSLLRAMFNKADEIGFRGPNPTRGIKKFHEEKRDRFLRPEEVPAFFTALNAEPPDFRDYFMLCLLTGARRGNMCSMAWADVHLDAAAWRIPDSKNREPILVHLHAKAVEILRRRQAEIEADEKRRGSPWVFPGGKKNRAGHLIDPKLAWDRVRKAAGMPDLRMHDLRRTLGSWQAIAGVSLNIIGQSLGHKSLQSTAVYARLTNEPVAQAVNQANDAILAAATPVKCERHNCG